MTELKTLNDIRRFEDLKHSDHFIVSSDILRQEAIKWIKDRKNRRNELSELMPSSWNFLNQEIDFWMERFNITDEDLE